MERPFPVLGGIDGVDVSEGWAPAAAQRASYGGSVSLRVGEAPTAGSPFARGEPASGLPAVSVVDGEIGGRGAWLGEQGIEFDRRSEVRPALGRAAEGWEGLFSSRIRMGWWNVKVHGII